MLPLAGLVGVLGVLSSSACATFVRTPVYEPVDVVRPAPVVYEHPVYESSVYDSGPAYYPRVVHDSTVIYREPSYVSVHPRGRPSTVIVNEADTCARDPRVSHHGDTVVVVDHHGRGHDEGRGHDNGRGNNFHNNGRGNGGGGNGHSRARP